MSDALFGGLMLLGVLSVPAQLSARLPYTGKKRLVLVALLTV